MLGPRRLRTRRARLVPIALTTAALSSAVLGASVTGTLSAFAASITNSSNTAASGSLVMKETGPDGTTNCLSSSGANNAYTACSTIDKYGGVGTPLTPGSAAHVTRITIANLGNVAATAFTLRPDACARTYTSGSATTSNGANLCDSLQLTVSCAPMTGNTPGTSVSVLGPTALSQLVTNGTVDIGSKSSTCIPQANGANSVQFTFSVAMPSNQDNTVQGQQVSQPLTWTFSGA